MTGVDRVLVGGLRPGHISLTFKQDRKTNFGHRGCVGMPRVNCFPVYSLCLYHITLLFEQKPLANKRDGTIGPVRFGRPLVSQRPN